jgi:hypothetical protein
MDIHFTRRQMAETAYRLRLATHRSWELDGDEATSRWRRITNESTSARVDRAYVSNLFDAADVPLQSVLRGKWRSCPQLLNRLGGDDVLPDVCLWSFVWWAAFNAIVPTWAVKEMAALWRHAGGAMRERLTLSEVWAANRRLRNMDRS